ncbi:MAG TPA: DUF72 domain-containing protein [Polyangiales bacterium]|jgi:uncharacterized protein YecE (DUF72 family)|nr:DUF72 domain-containing protein [Polyangiales bacterium]
MRARVGTSGYQYKFWRGSFYDEKLKEADMLPAYAAQLETVEINNTFYRMPKREVLAKWASQVPDGFRFAIKAPQRITHIERLKPPAEGKSDSVSYLFTNLEALGDKLGMVLFQLPPNLKKDMPRLQAFLARVPSGARISFEFRHESWNDPEVTDFLRERGIALCTADVDDGDTQLVPTAPFGYVRLRREVYSDDELAVWAKRIAAEPWSEVFVYFKHEEEAPSFAKRLISCFGLAAAVP